MSRAGDARDAPGPGPGDGVCTVDALGTGSTGRWQVSTRGSDHTFDLDAWTYCRRPRPGHGAFRNDGHVVRLTRVARWPRVGQTFLIWVEDHLYPGLAEHWHRSSTIESITRAD